MLTRLIKIKKSPRLAVLVPPMVAWLILFCAWGAWKGIRILRDERIASVDATLSEQSAILAVDVRSQLQLLMQQLTAIAERATAEQPKSKAKHGKSDAPSGSLMEGDWGIQSLSIWHQFSQGELPEREVFLTQKRYLNSRQLETLNSKEDEKVLRGLVVPAFQGESLIVSDPVFDPSGAAVLVMPLGEGQSDRVAAAHFRLKGIQRAFGDVLSADSFLINDVGVILAHRDSAKVGKSEVRLARILFSQGGPLAEAHDGSVRFEGPNGEPFRAVFRKLAMGRVAVVSAIPEASLLMGQREKEALLSAIGLGLLCFVIAGLVLVAYLPKRSKRSSYSPSFRLPEYGTSTVTANIATPPSGGTTAIIQDSREEADEPSVSGPAESSRGAEAASVRFHPDRQRVFALHVSVWQYDEALSELPTEELVEVLNLFFRIGAAVIRAHGGIFERSSGAAWTAIWRAQAPKYPEAKTSLRCALILRQEYNRLNESRKLDGHRPITVLMGMDWGLAMSAKIGPEDGEVDTIIGDVVPRAKALGQLSISVGKDLLVSQDVWSQVDKSFIGTAVAEAHLTSTSGLMACYAVQGYVDHEGKSVLVREPTIHPRPPEKNPRIQDVIPMQRWLVNNGSSILGPLTSAQIAQRLYTLDLDFDCECWMEGKGVRLPLSKSGIFGGSDEPDAIYWVFDGESIHGPMTEGFLRTALHHGAVRSSSFVCERSTVNGWKPVSELRRRLASPPPSPAAPGSTPSVPPPLTLSSTAPPASAPTYFEEDDGDDEAA